MRCLERFDDSRAAHRCGLRLVDEIALIVLLFLDAAQIDLDVLRERHIWPLRMLLIGLPLSILLGTLAAWAFLPGWPMVAVALVAAILAPTAALGQAVVTNEIVPARSRRYRWQVAHICAPTWSVAMA